MAEAAFFEFKGRQFKVQKEFVQDVGIFVPFTPVASAMGFAKNKKAGVLNKFTRETQTWCTEKNIR